MAQPYNQNGFVFYGYMGFDRISHQRGLFASIEKDLDINGPYISMCYFLRYGYPNAGINS